MQPTILLFGAGRSAHYLIDYLAKVVQKKGLRLIIAESNAQILAQKAQTYPQIRTEHLNIADSEKTLALIRQANVVISLLPPALHAPIADYCLAENKHLLTASYLPPELKQKHEQVQKKGLLFLYEMGLDPGIDHLSAMQMLNQLRESGAEIMGFQSFCGGLIAPESDNNPWNYKFTWNPQNVVLAGQGGVAKFKEQNQIKYVPYQQLFQRTIPLHFEGLGEWEAYYNRDSLGYEQPYQLKQCPTIIRGTIRKKGFAQAWNALVKLGLTDNSFVIENVHNLSYQDFLNAFLPPKCPTQTYAQLLAQTLGLEADSEVIQKLLWLDLTKPQPIDLQKATPAQILQQLLEQKWLLEPQDRDMVLMQHIIDYQIEGKPKQNIAEMIVKGENPTLTAMAKTVGLPLAFAAELILEEKVNVRGVHIPCHAELYVPILPKLAEHGIVFKEKNA